MRAVACLACRRRKSRCKKQPGPSGSSLMCLSHETPCEYPTARRSHRKKPLQLSLPTTQIGSQNFETGTVQPLNEGAVPSVLQASLLPPIPNTSPQTSHGNAMGQDVSLEGLQALDPPPDSSSNRRVLGPILDSDSRVMVDCFPQSLGGHRVMKSTMASIIARTSSVSPVFVTARRRPAGLDELSNPAQANLKLIERFLHPFLPSLMEIFLTRVNPCYPLLDPEEFREQLSNADSKNRVSPALLSCMYAQSLLFWNCDPALAKERRPDERFIWNLASESLFSELRLCPGIYTIAAVLLNVGGRPSILPFNNSGQLGFAVSVAFAMGLNRDPSTWDIPEQEKKLRRKVWWALLTHDRWSSFSCGTPPRIQNCQSNLQPPNLTLLCVSNSSEQQKAEIYIALTSLTEVLYYYLDEIHRVQTSSASSTTPLENKALLWCETTTGKTRRIVLRGVDMSISGAANLRLAFLSVQFLHSRISLERSTCGSGDVGNDRFNEEYPRTRRVAEDVVVFLEELGPAQLQDFWMPESSSIICFVMSFLIRSAIEWESVSIGSVGSGALSLATTLIKTLKTHKQNDNWDIGYSCIEQYSELLDWLNLQDSSTGVGDVDLDTLDAFITDGTFQDTLLFPMVFD